MGLFGGVPRYLVIDNFPAAVAGRTRCIRVSLVAFWNTPSTGASSLIRPEPVIPKTSPRSSGACPTLGSAFSGAVISTDWLTCALKPNAGAWRGWPTGPRHHSPKAPGGLPGRGAPRLLAWGGEPYEITHWRTAKVHPDHHVACQYALYSVPSSVCPPGQKVEIDRNQAGQQAGAHLLPRQAGQDPPASAQRRPRHRSRRLSRRAFRIHHESTERIKRSAALYGPAVAQFAQRLFDDRHPWSKIRQGHKLIRLGERYTAQRLDVACQRALAVDLIDVNRVERILVQALEQEAMPQLPLPMPAGRFARPGSVFALVAGGRS